MIKKKLLNGTVTIAISCSARHCPIAEVTKIHECRIVVFQL